MINKSNIDFYINDLNKAYEELNNGVSVDDVLSKHVMNINRVFSVFLFRKSEEYMSLNNILLSKRTSNTRDRAVELVDEDEIKGVISENDMEFILADNYKIDELNLIINKLFNNTNFYNKLASTSSNFIKNQFSINKRINKSKKRIERLIDACVSASLKTTSRVVTLIRERSDSIMQSTAQFALYAAIQNGGDNIVNLDIEDAPEVVYGLIWSIIYKLILADMDIIPYIDDTDIILRDGEKISNIIMNIGIENEIYIKELYSYIISAYKEVKPNAINSDPIIQFIIRLIIELTDTIAGINSDLAKII